MTKKKSINPYWYVLIAVNVLPLIGFVADILDTTKLAYFYWGECALVAIFALAMYARHLIVFFLLSAAIGLIVYLANPALLVNLKPVLLFWTLFSICWISYIEVGRSSYGQQIKQLAPKEQLTIYIIFLGLAIAGCFILTSTIMGDWVPEPYKVTFYKTFFSVAIIVPTISIGMLKVIDMVGQKHFIDFILGTYHHPVEKARIVLFLDMVGSSTIAEKLEAKQSMDLIAQFIYDCSYIFRIYGGDILNYTGDGLVVLWPINQSNAALSAAYKLRVHINSREGRARYWKKFGMVPDFRIGIHAGKIVLSQIGEEKLFIGLYGDVVNTAARLEQMCKELGTNILISQEVATGLNQSWKSILKPLGEKSVRGRDEKVKVYTIYKEV